MPQFYQIFCFLRHFGIECHGQNKMKVNKRNLLKIASKINQNKKVTPEELEEVMSFEKKDQEAKAISLLKKAAVPIAIVVGFLITVYPDETEKIVRALPAWTNLNNQGLRGMDYVWNIIGEPVGKYNILYHLPNVILYAFGILGIKKLFDAIDRRTWVDRVNEAKAKLMQNTQVGAQKLRLKKGHSALFVGKGDFIGQQFVLNPPLNQAVVISETKPTYTNLWQYYSIESGFEDLENVIENVCSDKTGEYVFFPVKDDQIFLPGEASYDLSPHRLDILCQDIRSIEKKNKWETKRIIIVGDRLHKSYVVSENKTGKIKNSDDTISLESIAKKYKEITLIDPTDLVLQKVFEIADGRKVAFRATREGIKEYKNRFYERLDKLKYRVKKDKKGILTIGYDLFEDQTEQQTLSRKIDDYYPVVLSKAVKDALIRNGYKMKDFIYVPDLVLKSLSKKASEQ